VVRPDVASGGAAAVWGSTASTTDPVGVTWHGNFCLVSRCRASARVIRRLQEKRGVWRSECGGDAASVHSTGGPACGVVLAHWLQRGNSVEQLTIADRPVFKRPSIPPIYQQ